MFEHFKLGQEDESVKEFTVLMANLSISGKTCPCNWLADPDVLMEDLFLQNALLTKCSRAVDGVSAGNPPEAQRQCPNKKKLDAVRAVHGNR